MVLSQRLETLRALSFLNKQLRFFSSFFSRYNLNFAFFPRDISYKSIFFHRILITVLNKWQISNCSTQSFDVVSQHITLLIVYLILSMVILALGLFFLALYLKPSETLTGVDSKSITNQVGIVPLGIHCHTSMQIYTLTHTVWVKIKLNNHYQVYCVFDFNFNFVFKLSTHFPTHPQSQCSPKHVSNYK